MLLYVTPDFELSTTPVDGPHAVLIVEPIDSILALLSEETPLIVSEYEDPHGILAGAPPDVLEDIGRRAAQIARTVGEGDGDA